MQIEKTVPEHFLTTRAKEMHPGTAALIAYPESAADVQQLVRDADEQGAHLVPIGAHTGLTSATYPFDNAWLVNLEKMNHILDLDEETLTLTVEAGVTLQQVIDFLEDKPFFYAPDPGEKKATIGGTASTNAGGMRAIRYGVTRDNIRALDVVLANGEMIHVGSVNKKNASGYDLKDLFIGAEGTLGIITKLQLKLIPRWDYKKSVLIGYDSVDELAPIVGKILTSSLAPEALELLERKGVELSEKLVGETVPSVKGNAHLLVTISENNQMGLDSQIKSLLEISEQMKVLDYRILEGEEEKRTWKVRDNILNGIDAAASWKMYDPCVPTNHFTDLVVESKKLGKELGIESAYFGHAGDGNVHICVLQNDYSDEEWREKLEEYEERLYNMILEYGGVPSAEHGIGREKKPYFPRFHDEQYTHALNAIKKAFDPKNIMNPGVTYNVD